MRNGAGPRAHGSVWAHDGMPTGLRRPLQPHLADTTEAWHQVGGSLADDEDARRLAAMQARSSRGGGRRDGLHVDDGAAGVEAMNLAAAADAAANQAEEAARIEAEQEAAVAEDPIVLMVLRAMEAQHTVV